MKEYPRQLFCEWNKGVNLNADFLLTPATREDNTPPMEVHKGNLSRIGLTINDQRGAETKIITANLPYTDISVLKQKTLRAQMMMDMQKMFFGTKRKEISPAYTIPIRMGQFSGQTPAKILSENPSNRTYLLNTRKILADNVSKYPKNQEQIDAIDDAVRLLDAESLEVSEGGTDGSYEIYSVEFKHKKPEKDGKKTVYSMKIVCHFDRKYQWEVQITNWMAPLKPMPGGLLAPDLTLPEVQASKRTSSLIIGDDAWTEIVDQLYRRLCQFEAMEFPNAYQIMMDNAWRPATVHGVSMASTAEGVGIGIH